MTLTETVTASPTRTLTGTPTVTPTFRIVEVVSFECAPPVLTSRRVTLTYTLTSYAEGVSLAIFSRTRKLVWSEEFLPAGPGDHEVEWDGRDKLGRKAPNGAYLAVLSVKRADVDIVVSTPLSVNRGKKGI
jgi:flagellar hook assembly protein FlgD